MRIAWLLALGSPFAACSDGPVAVPRSPLLLIVGWDGATFDLLDPLREAGRLPLKQPGYVE